MRVYEVETFGRGGLAHYAFNLSRALAERGHDVTIVTALDYELKTQADAAPGLGLRQPIARFTGRRPRLPRFLLSLVRKLEAIVSAFSVARLARRDRPDLVHLHCTNSIAVVYLWLLRRLPCPVVYTAHVVTPHEPMPLQNAIYGRIHRYCDLIIAHSDFDRERLREEFSVGGERIETIPHGEYGFFERSGHVPDRGSVRQELGLEPDAEVALFFGYIREYKGLDLLLEAWPMVAAARPRARLVIAGDPVRLPDARRRELESWAERLGAVHHFGYVEFADVTRYFGSADALVMPYRHISQSGVLFLGLSLGLPVVATRVGGLPEMLQDRDSALLVDRESPEELAAALIELFASSELRERLHTGALRVAAEHSWEAIAERTETAFARLTTSSQKH